MTCIQRTAYVEKSTMDSFMPPNTARLCNKRQILIPLSITVNASYFDVLREFRSQGFMAALKRLVKSTPAN